MESLKLAIIELERRQDEDAKLLKQDFLRAYESMKPINIIKNTFKEAAASKELKDNLINTAIGLAAGFAYNLVVEKMTNTPMKKMLSTALMAGIAAVVDKNSDTLKSLGKEFMKFFKGKSGDSNKDDNTDEAISC